MSQPLPVLLVHDDGELDEIAGILRGLGIGFSERRGEEARRAMPLPRDLLVASIPRALSLPPPPAGSQGAARLAVGASEGQAIRAGLRLSGFDLMVRLPVHPTALRLLLLRLLYRGSERRELPRVAVGLPARMRRWQRWHAAVLAEISVGGCRLLAPRAVPSGGRVVVEIPDAAGTGKPFRVKGLVVRSNAMGPGDATAVLAVAFPKLAPAILQRLEAMVSHFATGPASLPGPVSLLEPMPEPVAEIAPASLGEATEEAQGNRRRGPRTRYRSRIVTLGEEAAHVVIGRDLSMGGLRIEPHGALECGQAVSVALHGADLSVPLVLGGVVARDDGDAGLVICFSPLAPAQRSGLEKVLAERSSLDSLRAEGDGARVLAEIQPAGEKPAA